MAWSVSCAHLLQIYEEVADCVPCDSTLSTLGTVGGGGWPDASSVEEVALPWHHIEGLDFSLQLPNKDLLMNVYTPVRI